MARQAKLRQKRVGKCVYWYTKTGGDTYFGRADEVSHKEARKLFDEHVLKVHSEEESSRREAFSAGDLSRRPQALPRYDCNRFPHGVARFGDN